MMVDHDRASELLGAYALDAVDAVEAAAVDDHLVGCERCRVELDGHRKVAARLTPPAVAVPARLWTSIARVTIDASPATITAVRPRPSWNTARGRRSVAIAAAVVAAVGAGSAISDLRHAAELDRTRHSAVTAARALDAFTDPTTRRVELRSADGGIALRAAVRPDGSGYVLASALPALPGDETYQLWARSSNSTTSAGVLGPRPGTETIHVVHVTDATSLAVTRERRGGASAPTSPPVAEGSMPSD